MTYKHFSIEFIWRKVQKFLYLVCYSNTVQYNSKGLVYSLFTEVGWELGLKFLYCIRQSFQMITLLPETKDLFYRSPKAAEEIILSQTLLLIFYLFLRSYTFIRVRIGIFKQHFRQKMRCSLHKSFVFTEVSKKGPQGLM